MLKKSQVTSQIIPPTNLGAYGGITHNTLEIHRTKQLAWKQYTLASAATKKMIMLIMHSFKDYHFSEFQDDNGDIVGYTAIELFDHLMDQHVQPEDVADQVTVLHKILEQDHNPNIEPQVYYRTVQDARNTLASLNEAICTAYQQFPKQKHIINAWFRFGDTIYTTITYYTIHCLDQR